MIIEYGLTEAKISDVPINIGYGKNSERVLLSNNEAYQKIIGSLLYRAVDTRSDISASVTILAQRVSNPSQEDWNEAKRVLKYLKGIIKVVLNLGWVNNSEMLVGYADAN